MFSRRLQTLVSKLALFLVLFASLAPSVSHALAARGGVNRFAQEICSVNGSKKIVIQTITTKGQQITTALSGKSSDNPAALHLEHCPFCSAGANAPSMMPQSLTWLGLVEAQSFNQTVIVSGQIDSLQHVFSARAPPR